MEVELFLLRNVCFESFLQVFRIKLFGKALTCVLLLDSRHEPGSGDIQSINHESVFVLFLIQ